MLTRRRLLLLITLLTEFTAFLVIFSVSRALAERHVSMAWMGLIGGGFGVAASVSSALCGALSDRIGRRRSITLGLLLGLAGVAVAWVGLEQLWLLGVSYLLVGVALGAVYPAVSAWLTDGNGGHLSTRDTLRVLMGFCVAWNLGLIGGQTSGGWLYAAVGGAAPLGLAALLLLANLALVHLPMRAPTAAPAAALDGHDHPIAQRRQRSAAFARLSWIANVGGTFAMSMILHLFPTLMVALDVSADRHGVLLAISRGVVIATYLLMFVSRFWHYRFSTALGAQVVGVGGLLLLVVAEGTLGLVLGLAGVAVLVGHNYFASLYYSATRGGDEARGAAMGLHEATLTAGMAGGSIFGGILGAYAGVRAPYLLAAAVVFVLALVQGGLWWRFHRAGVAPVTQQPCEPAAASQG